MAKTNNMEGTSMHPFKLLVAFSPLFTTLIWGGTPDTTDLSTQHPERGLQFSINQLSLGAFQGNTFSYVRKTSTNQVERWGVSISTPTQLMNEDITSTYYNADDSSFVPSAPFDDDTDMDVSLNITVKRQTLNYRPAYEEMSFYWGWGPLASLSYQSSRLENENRLDSYKSPAISFGGIVTGGVEWFVRPNLSLHAEYQSNLTLTYQHQRYHDKTYSADGSYTEEKRTRDNYKVSSGSKALMGVTLWFL
ncbi:MAG: hypothetical protein K9N34_10235 [Candidatus Marinimicrobia bacterium]|nr:hypothetical protein [Candidatus Neomarinimicrobiota bacterium]MCF7841010.1 hypothetical protein [Candidatus Neomarinimicrobiota bacterium]MCF7903358.1 hypothetical protein [Candidatus Neomarinimicrobiota bacterium]